MDLVPLPKLSRMNIIANHLIDNIHVIDKLTNIHEDIKRKLNEFVAKYKFVANKQRRFKSFDESDLMMVHLGKK